MGLIRNVLLNLLTGHDDICFLCFEKSSSPMVNANQVVYESPDEVTDLTSIIKYLFKQDVLHMFTYGAGVVCDSCKTTAVNSYQFLKTYEKNLEELMKTIDSITDSVNKASDDVSLYKTLFVLLNTKDFTNEKLYDENYCSLKLARKRLTKLIKLKAAKDVDLIEKLVVICDRNSITEYNKVIKLKRTLNKKPYRINFDIPSVPDSELMLEVGSSTFECKYCHKSFKERTTLRQHCFKFHYPRNVKCSDCVKSFLNNDTLKKHIKKFHIQMKCNQCGRNYKNRNTMMKHMLAHDIQIACQECNRVYKSKEAFKTHFEICKQPTKRKSDQGTFICDYCNKPYCAKLYLAKHIKYEHENAEGFRCKYCNKTFYTPSRLKVHTYKHTQEKNFRCNICNKFFVTNTSLLYHTRLHTGERPYKCEHCDMAFLSASRRIDHVRSHHMAPSLECNICQKKFKGTGSLLKHKKRHLNPNSRLNTKCTNDIKNTMNYL